MNENRPSFSSPFEDIGQAVYYLEQGPNYEKNPDVHYVRRNFNLERMNLLLDRIGRPHRLFKSVHIAGTKGKGSSASIIECCLRHAGVRTGLYTSPHISSICERMRIDGIPPSDDDFCGLLVDLKPVIDDLRAKGHESRPTYFELTCALSFEYFVRAKADWAVVEVGLGGRLDATNVLMPQICLITPIGFDHMDKLGDTAAAIASEKAGILKPGIPLVLSRQDYPDAAETILQRANELKCPVWKVGEDIEITGVEAVRATPPYGSDAPGWRLSVRGPGWSYRNLYTPLLGRHQVYNTAAAIGVVEMLRERKALDFEPDSIIRAVASCQCPARVEVLSESPLLVLDTAHTVESIAALKDAICTHFPEHRTGFVFGCSSDKNHRKMLEILGGFSESITLTRSASSRAETVENLTRSARKAGFAEILTDHDPVRSLRQRLNKASDTDLTCVTGSFFLAGEVRDEFAEDSEVS